MPPIHSAPNDKEFSGEYVSEFRPHKDLESSLSSSIALVLGLVLIVLLTTWFYFPALFRNQTLANGDIAVIDAPFFELFSRVMKGQASPLWASGIFGGHPVFAEGQAAFANPLNILWAAVVTPAFGPIYAMNLFYWVLKVLGAIGLIGLCRCLGASLWAATFAALAVIYSPIWTYLQYTLPVFETLTWIPWSLWAFETWLRRPSVTSSVLLGGACTLVFLSGFPQGLHGTVIYIAVTLFVVPLQADLRRKLALNWPQRATLGLLACGVCVGLAAVQLLPLLELIPLSYRSHGIGIVFGGSTPAASYLRGFLVTRAGSDASYFPGPGSLLICALASAALLLPKPARVTAHALASLVLVLLGMEFASPLFRFVYEHHLLPGLHYFRETSVYLAIAAIGIAVLAAFGIDALARCIMQITATRSRQGWRLSGYLLDPRCLLLAAFWLWAIIRVQYNTLLAIHLAFVALAGAAIVMLVHNRRLHLLAPALTAVLAVEIIALRMHPFNFFAKDVFARPPEAAIIQNFPNWREYKMMTGSLAGTIALFPSLQADLGNRVRKALAAISPLTNVLWHISSMNGYLPLPLDRRMAIEPLLQDEIFGRVATPPGLRLIDLLGIRFITNGGELSTAGFRTLYLDQRSEIQTVDNRQHSLQENTAALPRFQFYSSCEMVDTLENAIVAIKSLKTRTLIIENPKHIAVPQPCNQDTNSKADATLSRIQLRNSSDTEYRVSVTSHNGGWLFLADANYPGWMATVDGKNVPLFSAQILGKAVPFPDGLHDVVFKFRSSSFHTGLLISLLTLAISSLWSIIEIAKNRLSQGHRAAPIGTRGFLAQEV